MAKIKLTNDDFCGAAKLLRCEAAAIKAVAEVESKGEGFYANGFPTILYERHVFRKYTSGAYNKTHPELSGPQGNYGKAGANQRRKFTEAYALNPDAAIMACSWGRFQVMGFNHKIAGFPTVKGFYEAMQTSEAYHLKAFVGFILSNHLADEIRNHDWAGFAYSYNGAGYKANHYDTAMAAAYKRFAKENIDCSKVSAANATANPVTAPTASSPVTEPPSDPQPPTNPDPPQEEGQTIVSVPPVVTEKEEGIVSKIKTWYAALPAFLLSVLGGFWSWLQGAATEIIVAFLATAGVVAIIYLIVNYRSRDHEKQRQFEAEQKQKDRDFQLTVLQLQSAMDPNKQTVRVSPPVIVVPNAEEVTQ